MEHNTYWGDTYDKTIKLTKHEWYTENRYTYMNDIDGEWHAMNIYEYEKRKII